MYDRSFSRAVLSKLFYFDFICWFWLTTTCESSIILLNIEQVYIHNLVILPYHTYGYHILQTVKTHFVCNTMGRLLFSCYPGFCNMLLGVDCVHGCVECRSPTVDMVFQILLCSCGQHNCYPVVRIYIRSL